MNSLQDKSIVAALERCSAQDLADFLRNRRWFAGKARTIHRLEILDVVPLLLGTSSTFAVLAKLAYVGGHSEIYDLPLTYVPPGAPLEGHNSRLRLHSPEGELEFIDALSDEAFLGQLLEAIADDRCFSGSKGEIRARKGNLLPAYWDSSQPPLTAVLNRGEQSNSSVIYGKRLILKLFRRLEPGINPDLEVGSFLTQKTAFRNIAPVAGSMEYGSGNRENISLGILQGFIANRGDAWEFTLQQLAEYYPQAARKNVDFPLQAPRGSALELSSDTIPADIASTIGDYLNWAKLLGQRTAELHLALASACSDPAFRPEPFTADEQQQFARAAVRLLTSTFQILRDQLSVLPPDIRTQADNVLEREGKLRERLLAFERLPVGTVRTRIHGDYHLGQLLFTGKDFIIIDFEGEPSRPLEERRKKRSPLQDVAGMLRSFHYAAFAPLLNQKNSAAGLEEELSRWGTLASYWQKWVSAAFLREYRATAGEAPFIPREPTEFAMMLDIYLLDKAIYELGYEVNHRPTWLRTPLGGISELAETAA